jgi:hypothetical protein
MELPKNNVSNIIINLYLFTIISKINICLDIIKSIKNQKRAQMVKLSIFNYAMLKSALWKSAVATILFGIFYLFYNTEIVRSHVEDVAFDTVNKFSIYNKEIATDTPHVLVFAFDDLYMKKNQLFDEDNISNRADICDNTPKNSQILSLGCSKKCDLIWAKIRYSVTNVS